MRKFSSQMALGALVATLGLAAAGCSQISRLKAVMAFKDGNQLYQQQDYKGAAAKYEETLASCKGSGSDCTDPKLTYATSSSATATTTSSARRAAARRPTTRC